MSKKPKLKILIGNIGSGKSTYLKKYQKKGYIIISRDSLRYGIGAGNYIYNENYEPIIFKTEEYLFENFCSEQVNLVIDEINMSKKMRERYISIGKAYNYEIIAVNFPILKRDIAVERRLFKNHGDTSKTIWRQVWSRFNHLYETPNKREGFHKIIKLKKKDIGLK